MIRVVADTNVLVSSFLGSVDRSTPRQVRRLWRAGVFSLCFSDASIAELREVLGRFTVSRPEIRDEIRDFLAELPQLAERVSLPPVLPRVVANDPDDDVIVATAVAGKVDAIVSGDADLLALGSHARIPVLSPRQFIDWLSKQAPGA